VIEDSTETVDVVSGFTGVLLPAGTLPALYIGDTGLTGTYPVEATLLGLLDEISLSLLCDGRPYDCVRKGCPDRVGLCLSLCVADTTLPGMPPVEPK
jgi:hypothetical protein